MARPSMTYDVCSMHGTCPREQPLLGSELLWFQEPCVMAPLLGRCASRLLFAPPAVLLGALPASHSRMLSKALLKGASAGASTIYAGDPFLDVTKLLQVRQPDVSATRAAHSEDVHIDAKRHDEASTSKLSAAAPYKSPLIVMIECSQPNQAIEYILESGVHGALRDFGRDVGATSAGRRLQRGCARAVEALEASIDGVRSAVCCHRRSSAFVWRPAMADAAAAPAGQPMRLFH